MRSRRKILLLHGVPERLNNPQPGGRAFARLDLKYVAITTLSCVPALVTRFQFPLREQQRICSNFSVSWIRHRDLHILTVGGYTYTSDQRFQATHSPQTDDWTLHIKWAQQRDAGVYECQVSTQPVRSFFVTLHVVDCDEIYQRMFSDQGVSWPFTTSASIHFCIVYLFSHSFYMPEPPEHSFSYLHPDTRQVISYDSSRGGVSVVTEKGAATTSYLLVQDAAPADSGRYSCSPSNAEVASVRVHVLNGERPAAMQTGSAGLSNSSRCIIALLAACALHARWLRAQLAS
ncbi:hypothetical protein K1T71_002229 [Dendrolimus kikuchii]|uniref:Uncharacterized protein n=1 Tax=Dendrolimus kikuchii TaxID=765133 RepID=A0ACC1DGB8_9NEOP|nr:hypothetical protein K1T71_002229 [Dendrolimus kikuchii]